MALIRNLVIENFRGFDNLRMDDFGRVNILIGRNNSGKSSVLEALFILIGMSNPSLPASTNKQRGMHFAQSGFLKSLFHNLDTGRTPLIQCDYGNNSSRRLRIEPVYNLNVKEVGITSSNTRELVGLEMRGTRILHTVEDDSFGSYMIENGQENVSVRKNLLGDELNGVFVTSHVGEGLALAMVAELVKKKREFLVLDELRKFDTRINGIKILPDNIYFDMEGLEELLQVNLVGDGMRRFLNIISVIANSADQVVMIDEIENGLHYSANKLLWQAIMSLSSSLNVQLFITTHNLETLQCLNSLLEEENNAGYRQDINLYTIARTKLKGFQTYLYKFGEFNTAINNEIELRD